MKKDVKNLTYISSIIELIELNILNKFQNIVS